MGIINNLASEDEEDVLEALWAMSGADRPAEAPDGDLVVKLIRSPDPLIRERALFVFGIRQKMSGLCEEFENQLVGEDNIPLPVLSALILSMNSCGCELRQVPAASAALGKYLQEPEFVDEIGGLIVGFVLMINGRIGRDEFKNFIRQAGAPSSADIQRVGDLI